MSRLTSPYVAPVFVGFLAAWRYAISLRSFFLWFSIQLVFTTLIPGIIGLALVRRGWITELHVPRQEDRTVFYLSVAPCPIAAFLLLYLLNAPVPLLLLAIGYMATLLAFTLINLKTKISSHAGAVSGSVAAFFFMFKSAALPTLIFVPLVIWSRLALRQHSLGQVLLGTLLAAAIMVSVFSAYHLSR